MARGQLRCGGSLPVLPGRLAGGFPGTLWEGFGNPKPHGIHQRRLRHPPRRAAQPRWHCRCQPEFAPKTGEKLWGGEDGGGGNTLTDRARPRGARVAPGSPPGTEGGQGSTGWVPSLARDPGRRRPPRLREAFQASRCGRGAAAGGGGEQKRLFSHATYFTSRTFCAFQPCL